MTQCIYIYTDNNRRQLQLRTSGTPLTNANCRRLVYQEKHETEQAVSLRLGELHTYTRMQLERVVRRSNPDWLNLNADAGYGYNYHPGAKLSPNVPNFTSVR